MADHVKDVPSNTSTTTTTTSSSTSSSTSPPASTPSASSLSTLNYPFAAAPDIIRAHQKDAYFQGVLLNQLSSLLRPLLGARFIHAYTTETRTVADALYLSLTTLLGNRTLGEEYCDIIQIEDDTLKLPTLFRRAGYILSCVVLPYSLTKVLPSLRAKLRAKLEANLRRLSRRRKEKSWSFKLQSYILDNLHTFTSPSPIHALTLTIFYFSGSYYQLSKRIFGLRYIFSKKINVGEQRVGYEVLGVLLLLQISVQAYLHFHSTLQSAFLGTESGKQPVPANAGSLAPGTAMLDHGVEVEVSVSLDPNTYTTNNELLFESTSPSISSNLQTLTHTPVLPSPKYNLENSNTMSWIKSPQQRKCTLCLEELKDPAALGCGHVFCWSCIGDWVREKPECPLCRRPAMGQHILALRG